MQGQKCLYGLLTQSHIFCFSSEKVLFPILALFKEHFSRDPLTIFEAPAVAISGMWILNLGL